MYFDVTLTHSCRNVLCANINGRRLKWDSIPVERFPHSVIHSTHTHVCTSSRRYRLSIDARTNLGVWAVIIGNEIFNILMWIAITAQYYWHMCRRHIPYIHPSRARPYRQRRTSKVGWRRRGNVLTMAESNLFIYDCYAFELELRWTRKFAPLKTFAPTGGISRSQHTYMYIVFV